jgi:hypothetical protein
MNIPSVRSLEKMIQPIFKKHNGQPQTYGETSKKDLIRVAYIYAKEAANFMRGKEFFMRKYTSMILLHHTQCPKCADKWSEYGEVIKHEETSDIPELEDK